MTLPRLSEVEQAYADRDAALERLGAVLAERHSLSRLHEEATERTVALSAVIEKAKAAPYHDNVRDGIRVQSVYSVLASAPGDVLRDHDAEKWDEGLDAGRDRWMDFREFGEPPVNPYRTEGGN